MTCKKCGTQLEDFQTFCHNCGVAVESKPAQEQTPVAASAADDYYSQTPAAPTTDNYYAQAPVAPTADLS